MEGHRCLDPRTGIKGTIVRIHGTELGDMASIQWADGFRESLPLEEIEIL